MSAISYMIHNTTMWWTVYQFKMIGKSWFSSIFFLLFFSKAIQTEGWGYTFSKKTPELLGLSLCPKKFQIKWHFTQGNSTKILLHPLDIPKPKTNTHGNITWFFLHHHWKFHFFISWPLKFPHFIFSILLEIPCPQPCLFLNIPLISINQSVYFNERLALYNLQIHTYTYSVFYMLHLC